MSPRSSPITVTLAYSVIDNDLDNSSLLHQYYTIQYSTVYCSHQPAGNCTVSSCSAHVHAPMLYPSHQVPERRVERVPSVLYTPTWSASTVLILTHPYKEGTVVCFSGRTERVLHALSKYSFSFLCKYWFVYHAAALYTVLGARKGISNVPGAIARCRGAITGSTSTGRRTILILQRHEETLPVPRRAQ